MKNIITHGCATYSKTCPSCGCVFTYEKEDITISHTVVCPECDCYIEHRETFTPSLTSLPEPCAGCPWQGYYRQNFPSLNPTSDPYKIPCASSNKIDPTGAVVDDCAIKIRS